MALPNWLYISQLTGNSGTTIITVSATTNNKPYSLITDLFVDTNNYDLEKDVVVGQNANGVKPTPTGTTEYLTFEILSAGTINWVASENYGYLFKTIEYTMDNGLTWTSITSDRLTISPSINVSVGDVVKFRGDNTGYGDISTSWPLYSYFSSTAKFNVNGNIMSLIDSQDFMNKTSLDSGYTFYGLFQGCTGLIDAGELVLPATTLTKNCYYEMFADCTSLIQAPALPATTLVYGCYGSMFAECTSLVNAPSILPATTLAEHCYQFMFNKCTALTTAPELPATTLVNYCYWNMFFDCSSLNYIKCLATNVNDVDATHYWVVGVASSGTFIKKRGANWSSGNNDIPVGWTVIEQ